MLTHQNLDLYVDRQLRNRPPIFQKSTNFETRFAAWRRPPIAMTHKYKIVANIWFWWALQKIRPLALKIRPPEPPEHSEVGGCISLRF